MIKMYEFVYNEKMVYNGMELRQCSCGKWLPPLCMAFENTMAEKMPCRRYFCPKCATSLPASKLSGKPLVTLEEFLASRIGEDV